MVLSNPGSRKVDSSPNHGLLSLRISLSETPHCEYRWTFRLCWLCFNESSFVCFIIALIHRQSGRYFGQRKLQLFIPSPCRNSNIVIIIRAQQNVRQENQVCTLRFDIAAFMIDHQVYNGNFHKFSYTIYIIPAKYKHIFAFFKNEGNSVHLLSPCDIIYPLNISFNFSKLLHLLHRLLKGNTETNDDSLLHREPLIHTVTQEIILWKCDFI